MTAVLEGSRARSSPARRAGSARRRHAASARRARASSSPIVTATPSKLRRRRSASAGHDAHGQALDVTDEADVERVAGCAPPIVLGGLDIAVANAGVLAREPARRALAGGIRAHPARQRASGSSSRSSTRFRTCARQGEARSCARRSQAGVHGYRDLTAYCASKFAVVGIVESLAQELAGDGIRVCAVAPGVTADRRCTASSCTNGHGSGAWTRRRPRRGFAARFRSAATATPDEVANAFVYLASPQAAYVSGVALVLDAGELSG